MTVAPLREGRCSAEDVRGIDDRPHLHRSARSSKGRGVLRLRAGDARHGEAARNATIGFGKKYPEFWINRRDAMGRVAEDSGVHICLRAQDSAAVDAFHAAALKGGGTSDGAPGLREKYHGNYYAAFIRDPDGNRIEAVTFLRDKAD